MKIWKSFSCEHSAKLRIIGKFKSAKDAQEAAESFNRLLKVEEREPKGDRIYSDEIAEVCREYNLGWLSEHDPQQLDFFDEIKAIGDRIEVKTDEVEIQVLLKVLLQRGARVELYSGHAYPEEY